MKNIFHVIGDFFASIGHLFSDPAKQKVLTDKLAIVQQFLPEAIEIAKKIDALVPNKTTEEVIALANKYELHVSDAVLADPAQVNTLLQNAALKELQVLVGQIPGMSNGILNTMITLAVTILHASK